MSSKRKRAGRPLNERRAQRDKKAEKKGGTENEGNAKDAGTGGAETLLEEKKEIRASKKRQNRFN